MVFRLTLIIFLFFFKIAFSNIIYDKDGITITNIELNSYIEIYQNNFGINLSKNQAVKNINLMKRLIKFLSINNPDFIISLDQNIELQFGKEVFDNIILLDFLRFQKTKNEFISDYFQNQFNIKDLELIFLSFKEFKLPISKTNCLTIENLHEVSKDKYFIKNFFENLKNNEQNYETIINNVIFDVCINDEIFKKIEQNIINFIEKKIETNFNNFIYGMKV